MLQSCLGSVLRVLNNWDMGKQISDPQVQATNVLCSYYKGFAFGLTSCISEYIYCDLKQSWLIMSSSFLLLVPSL